MDGSKRRVKVSICDETYTLVSDEEETYVIQAAAQIDGIMRSLMQAGITQRGDAAILAALQNSIKLLHYSAQEKRYQELVERLSFLIDRTVRLL